MGQSGSNFGEEMKVGDLVRMPDCPPPKLGKCPCFFCFHESNRIGVVTGNFWEGREAVWNVHFVGAGGWEFLDSEFDTGEVILIHEV